MSLSTVSESLPTCGITYEITNAKGVKSYLIGTYHVVNAEMLRKSNFQQLVDKCQVLYNESGGDFFISSAHGSIPEENHAYQHVEYRYDLDAAITLRAWCNHIPIISLDKGLPEVNKKRDEWRQSRYELGPEAWEKKIMATRKWMGTDRGEKEEIDEWFRGDTKQVASYRKYAPKWMVGKRDRRWAEILIPQLKKTQTPICVAVGCGHVVGKDSLADKLKKAGLKLTLITPENHRSRL